MKRKLTRLTPLDDAMFAVTPILRCGGTGGRYSTWLTIPCGGRGGASSSLLRKKVVRIFVTPKS